MSRMPSAPSLLACLLLAALVLAPTSFAASAPAFLWETVVDGFLDSGGGGYEVLGDVVPTADGGLVAGGYALPPGTYDNRLQQPLLIRYDAVGRERWRSFLDGPDDNGYRVARIRPAPDGGFVVACVAWTPWQPDDGGMFYETSFVARLDGGGAEVWRHRIDPLEMDLLGDFDLTADGSVVAAGRVWLAGGGTSTAVLKLAPDGSLVWLRQAGSDHIEGVERVAACSDGGFYASALSGYAMSLSRYAPDGRLLWTSPVDHLDGEAFWYEKHARGLTVTPDGGCVVAGSARESRVSTYGPYRPFLATFDDGGRQTATLVVQTESRWSHAVERLSDGGLLSVEGVEGSDTGPVFVRYDRLGTELWRAEYGAVLRERYIEAVRATADGGFVAVGGIDAEPRYSSMDGYVLRTRGEGAPEVRIDVLPGNPRNPLNPASRGVLPVALLSSPGFDATRVDLATVTLEGAPVVRDGRGRCRAVTGDVDGDGLADVRLFFSLPALRVSPDTERLTLRGVSPGGVDFSASDAVRVVPKAPAKPTSRGRR